MKPQTSLLLFAALLLTTAAHAQSYVPEVGETRLPVLPVVPLQAYAFPLRAVRLLPSPFTAAMQRDEAYLLSLEPDRFLHRFHQNAGLPVKGEMYGGWESRGVSGHSLGHYLSAVALAYASTGDARFRQRADYIVGELARCQAARKTGYVGGIPEEDRIFAEVARGDIRSSGFDLNGGWVPWYTVHKVLAGLEDAYLYADNQQAKQVATKLADWCGQEISRLSDAQVQQMLNCEQGGMNEALATVYAFTGEAKYLALSRRFDHRAVLDPLAAHRDELAGKHANTQIPKVLGRARRYELAGDPADSATARFFWQAVTGHHSYVIGGNSDYEHFGEPDQLSAHLSANTTETCNTYNMLKLTRHLFAWQPAARLGDYYERALYNHILASQNPESGMMCYYVPLQMGAKKLYNTPTESFWCCTGTGMENHVKYAEQIYSRGRDGSLYANLFIPSVLTWREKGVVLRQTTRFPASDTVRFAVTEARRPTRFTLRLRRPAWAGSGVQVLVNGRAQAAAPAADGYLALARKWRAGDQVTLVLPRQLFTEAMPDNARRLAVLYGPLVLAGTLGSEAPAPLSAPVLVSNQTAVSDWVEAVPGQPLTFRTRQAARPADVTLRPFYQVHEQYYSVYFDQFTEADWAARQLAYEAEQRRLAALAARTVDLLRVGEMQPERDHNLHGEHTNTGDMGPYKWRDANQGGYFAFDMAVDATKSNDLVLTYFGSDAGNRDFDLLVDGTKIATQQLTGSQPGQLFDVTYPVPPTFTRNKKQVTVTVQAHPNSIAGGVFGVRVVRR